jgi:hypothetical protein
MLALQVPAVEIQWSQGCSARPPIAVGVWYKHLDGGLPVLGVRFGGLKAVRFGLSVRALRYVSRGFRNKQKRVRGLPAPPVPPRPRSWVS